MYLTEKEQAMLDGKEGRVKQVAMDLLVRYGEALGAERMVETNNCAVALVNVIDAHGYELLGIEPGDYDSYFCRQNMNMDHNENLTVPELTAKRVCTLCGNTESYMRYQGKDAESFRLNKAVDDFASRIGCELTTTCAPILCGVMPLKGEHCAWSESSAIIYINSVLGARTNSEGIEASACAAITGRIPYCGLHTDEGRLGTHLIHVERQPKDDFEWGLLGYYAGVVTKRGIPVIDGIREIPSNDMLRHAGAALSTAGEIDMFHVVGVTPEARTLKDAFGGNTPQGEFVFGEREMQGVIDRLSFAVDNNVDWVMIGCPHCSIEQIKEIAKYLKGKTCKTKFFVQTAPSIKSIADHSGYTQIIEEAGGFIIEGGCALVMGTVGDAEVVASNSEKFAHYVNGMPGNEDKKVYCGSLYQCMNAAVTGMWL